MRLAVAALLLAWPALLNHYPLVFSDTGAFLALTAEGWPVWDKPPAYGLALGALGAGWTLWLPLLAQALLLAWLIGLAARVVAGQAGAGFLLLVCAGLAAGSAAPWFAGLLLPDILAPCLVLALALLGAASERLGRGERLGLQTLAAFAMAAHPSHLPLGAALVLLMMAWRGRAALRCAVPLAAALLLVPLGNLALHGRFALSPYGAVFPLARLVADGPAVRTIAARCPEAGWHLCRWAGRLPEDSDEFLWSGEGPVWTHPGGPIGLTPEAAAILAETLRREPLGVLRAVLANGGRQLLRNRVGDTLGPENLAGSVGKQLALGFPAAEGARFAAGLQARGVLPLVAAPFLILHPLVLLAGLGGTLLGGWWAARAGDAPRLGLVLCVLAGIAVNALVTGGLSGPHDRYGARLAWLLPLAALLVLRPATGAAAAAPPWRSSRASPAACPRSPAPPAAP
ncbi:hypothetical protein JMJ55_15475 [Belnapia sp. T6]|uniref:Dolichyl-phosphate-mannose-protein mannosyltransferase n=1 Tax=Belnapia mucosa TaxID=2804532 RepID=A0ABS1V4Z4_9PROT|nr:hypothetical protein [Belnapia mucosa]MBL6456736.1 hypothetical protein [Belnapia mucosa]